MDVLVDKRAAGEKERGGWFLVLFCNLYPPLGVEYGIPNGGRSLCCYFHIIPLFNDFAS